MNIIPRTSRARWQIFGLTLVEVMIILITLLCLFLTWYEGGNFAFLTKIKEKIKNGKYYFLLLRILLTLFFCGSLLFLLLPVWKKQKGYVVADSVFGFLFQPQNFVFQEHFELGYYEEEAVEKQKEAEREKITAEQLYHQKLLLILEAMTTVLDQNKQLLGELSQKTLALQKEHDVVFKNLSDLISELVKLPVSQQHQNQKGEKTKNWLEENNQQREKTEEESSETDDFEDFLKINDEEKKE